MKKVSIALASLGLSATVFATLPAATEPSLINVPLLQSGFTLSATGYFLQPTDNAGDLNYATVNYAQTGSAPYSKTFSNSPGYNSWGWSVMADYIFADTTNDISLSYFGLSTQDYSSENIPFGSTTQTLGMPDFDNQNRLYFYNPITSATSRVEYGIDQVDLLVGQLINIGCRTSVHPTVGLRWAQLDRTLDNDYSAPPLPSSPFKALPAATLYEHQQSDYSGIGPIVGLDANYYIGYGFGAVAHVDGAVLIGTMDAKADATQSIWTATSPTNVITNIYQSQNQAEDTQRIVPIIDAKLGANYTYLLDPCNSQSSISFEAGWDVSHYYNAVDRLSMNASSAPFYNTAHNITGKKTTDFSINGPYFAIIAHI